MAARSTDGRRFPWGDESRQTGLGLERPARSIRSCHFRRTSRPTASSTWRETCRSGPTTGTTRSTSSSSPSARSKIRSGRPPARARKITGRGQGRVKDLDAVLPRGRSLRQTLGPRRLPVRALGRRPDKAPRAARCSAARRPACECTRPLKRSLLSRGLLPGLLVQEPPERPLDALRRSRSPAAIPAADALSRCCIRDGGPGAMRRNG